MTNFHYLVDWVRETGNDPPPYVRPVWSEYVGFRRARAAADAHLTMHASHYATMDPDEARFITPEIVRAFCIAGEPPRKQTTETVVCLRFSSVRGLRDASVYAPWVKRAVASCAQRLDSNDCRSRQRAVDVWKQLRPSLQILILVADRRTHAFDVDHQENEVRATAEPRVGHAYDLPLRGAMDEPLSREVRRHIRIHRALPGSGRSNVEE
jgi:hypothetical protein